MVHQILTFGVRQRLLSAILVVVFTAVAVLGLLRLEIDTSYDSLISENDPGRPAYEANIAEFGSDNTTIIYLRDAALFSEERLLLIEDLIAGLEEIEAVERVESLFSVLSIRDDEGMLDASPLMDTTPEDEDEIALVRKNALYSPLIRSNFISADAQVTAVNVTVKRDRADPKFNLALDSQIGTLLEPLRPKFEKVFHIGPPRLNVEIERGMFADMQTLSPLSTMLLIGAIIFFLRTPSAALIPMSTSIISVLWTFGFMGFMGLPLTLLTAIVPSLIIVIGSTEDTHLLTAYLHGLKEGGKPDRAKAISFMAHHVGMPIFITSLTTTVGFMTNALNDIPLIQGFAYATAFAMFANLIATVLVVPLFLIFFGPLKTKLAPGDERPKGIIGAIVRVLDSLVDRHSKWVIAVTVCVLAVFGTYAFTVGVSNDPLSYFRADSPLVRDAETLHGDLAGMQVFYLTLAAKERGAFKEPANLRHLAAIQEFMQGQAAYDKSISLNDFLTLVNREMHQGKPEFAVVPESRELVEQFLLMFQRGDIERYISADFSRANIVVRHNLSDSRDLNGKLDELDEKAREVLAGSGISVTMSGENLMINRAAESLFSGQVQSLILLVIIIFVIMTFLFTSIAAGFLSLVPNAIPVILNFGAMGLLGIPLNPGTATVAVIAVGIAIDDTIHLLTRYNDECRRNPDQAAAVRATVWAEAVPVVSTSISLALGFVVLLFSNFAIVAQFGALAAATMIYAMLADLLVTPIVLKHIRLAGIWEIVALQIGREVLENSPLFVGMSTYQIKKTILLSIVSDYGEGEVIIEEDKADRAMYVLLSGSVDVVTEVEGGEEHFIETLQPGAVFGEAGFVVGVKRTASIIARQPVKVLTLDPDKTANSLKLYPRIAAKLHHNISRILGERLASVHEILEAKAAGAVDDKA